MNLIFNLLTYFNRWGQIAILTAIADYKVSNGKEAESICDRVMPRLQHANGAVVLSAIKVKKKTKQRVGRMTKCIGF
jgi:vesicle coat complex subunit